MKLLINIKGGIIQHIVSNDPDVEIFIHDYDLAESWTIEDENNFASSTSPDEIVNDKKFNDYVYDAYYKQERIIQGEGKDMLNFPHPQLDLFE